MQEMYQIDALTQAYNEFRFNQDISNIQNSVLNLPAPISCVRIDIDNLKDINESYSHVFGNEVFKHIINTIRLKIRSRDRIYRLGGDEFGILCPDLSILETKGMFERVLYHLSVNPLKAINIKTHDESFFIATLSIGISECFDLSKIGEHFDKADLLAFESKRNGKNQITIENRESK
jgi:diguanylate cyclase (GGDEF)-like protein